MQSYPAQAAAKKSNCEIQQALMISLTPNWKWALQRLT